MHTIDIYGYGYSKKLCKDVSKWVNKTLYEHKGKMYYKTCKIEDYDYEDQPHEIEARQQEQILYSDYLKQSELYGKLLKTTGG